MKIFSQSTACALIAVANATHLLEYFPLQATDNAPFFSTNGQISCVLYPSPSSCKYELYGGWDLPVPPSTKSELEYLTDGEPWCFMGHLPRRGEMGKMERIDCSSHEMTEFVSGDGPTGFTGFVSWEHSYMYQGDMSMRDQKCWLVANGRLTPILGECRDAVYNTKPDRHVVEDLSDSNEIKGVPDKYYY